MIININIFNSEQKKVWQKIQDEIQILETLLNNVAKGEITLNSVQTKIEYQKSHIQMMSKNFFDWIAEDELQLSSFARCIEAQKMSQQELNRLRIKSKFDRLNKRNEIANKHLEEAEKRSRAKLLFAQKKCNDLSGNLKMEPHPIPFFNKASHWVAMASFGLGELMLNLSALSQMADASMFGDLGNSFVIAGMTSISAEFIGMGLIDKSKNRLLGLLGFIGGILLLIFIFNLRTQYSNHAWLPLLNIGIFLVAIAVSIFFHKKNELPETESLYLKNAQEIDREQRFINNNQNKREQTDDSYAKKAEKLDRKASKLIASDTKKGQTREDLINRIPIEPKQTDNAKKVVHASYERTIIYIRERTKIVTKSFSSKDNNS